MANYKKQVSLLLAVLSSLGSGYLAPACAMNLNVANRKNVQAAAEAESIPAYTELKEIAKSAPRSNDVWKVSNLFKSMFSKKDAGISSLQAQWTLSCYDSKVMKEFLQKKEIMAKRDKLGMSDIEFKTFALSLCLQKAVELFPVNSDRFRLVLARIGAEEITEKIEKKLNEEIEKINNPNAENLKKPTTQSDLAAPAAAELEKPTTQSDLDAPAAAELEKPTAQTDLDAPAAAELEKPTAQTDLDAPAAAELEKTEPLSIPAKPVALESTFPTPPATLQAGDHNEKSIVVGNNRSTLGAIVKAILGVTVSAAITKGYEKVVGNQRSTKNLKLEELGKKNWCVAARPRSVGCEK